MMICANCGFENEDDAQNCSICGEKLAPSLPQLAEEKEQICPKCGHKGEVWLGLCPKCGTPVTDKTSNDEEKIKSDPDPFSDIHSLDHNASEPAEKTETNHEWEALLSSEDDAELWADNERPSPEETSLKQVHSTLDTLLSDLLEIEIREKERNDLLEELAELPPSLYAEEEMPSKKKMSLKLPSFSTQTRSMLEWFLIFVLIFTLFIFGISAGLWAFIQIL